MHDIRFIRRTIIALGIALFITLGLLVYMFVKLSGDEHTACVVQRNVLPATRAEAAVTNDLYGLLTAKPTAAQKRQQPPQTTTQFNDLFNLRWDLGRSKTLESRQPLTRIC